MKYAVLIFLFLINILAAQACDCIIVSIKQQIKSIPYIVRGEVIEVLNRNTKEHQDYRQILATPGQKDTTRYGYTVKIRIENNFKGHFKAGDIIEINSTYSNCDLIFELNKQYALFLHQEKQLLFTVPCSYSVLLGKNKESKRLLKTICIETNTKLK
ncbi:MAG: hypothetical protein ACRYFR_15455 [Janthinobacterium lividum]